MLFSYFTALFVRRPLSLVYEAPPRSALERELKLRDPADELILEAAVNGRAAVIVTHNVGDFRPATMRFGVRTPTPAEFLKELPK